MEIKYALYILVKSIYNSTMEVRGCVALIWIILIHKEG
jgi:hypothetical protein